MFMKKVTVLSLMLVFSFALFAQTNWVKIDASKSVNPEIQVVEASDDAMIIKLNLNAYALEEVETPNGTELIVRSPECPNSYLKGAPDLPFFTSAINIADQGSFKFEVISSEFELVENINIAPSKGSILRTVDPASVPFEYGRAYQMNEFLPFELSDMSEPYILRDLRGSNLTIHPFAYNAVSNDLRVYTEIVVKIKFTSDASANELFTSKNNRIDEFESIYNNLFINYKQSSKYTPVEEGTPGTILIICADGYEAAMADYITWKQEKGIPTEMVLMSAVGSTNSQVETYIQNYYDTEDLTYVLLVGDADNIPPMVVSGDDSDNAFGYVSGSDGYADIFVGRFSANSIADVETQVDRTIAYEKDMSTSDTWLENAFGSASNEGDGNGHDGGESDAAHIDNIRPDMEGYGYTVTHVNQDGGSNAQISTVFNNGIGVGYYIGHGDTEMWVNTTYTNTEVNGLNNVKKLPFIWSVACVNGDFDGNTCFAEAWLRATSSGSPAGAVAFLAATINQSWTEPMTGQDEMIDILVESYASNIKRTYGGISMNGIFLMIEEGGQGQNMADTWTCFGDASLMVRTTTPEEMAISHLSTLSVGQTEFTVSCDVDDALVSLTKVVGDETVIIGTGFASGGSAIVTIDAFDSPGNMKVTVTAYNKVTYQEDVMVIVPDGPYVVATGYTINDAAANNNGAADYNETVMINQSLQNVGVAIATSVDVVASTSNINVTITQASASFGDIAIDATATENDAFTMQIADGIADQESAMIDLVITDGASNEWESSYPILINAPNLAIEFIAVDDSDTGNGNGTIDAGETVNIVVSVVNNGHATAEAGDVNLVCVNPNVTVNMLTLPVAELAVSTPVELEFEVVVDGDTPMGESICFDFDYIAGSYNAELNVCLAAGLQIEDWESNSFGSYAWDNTDVNPWTIVTDEVYEGTYSSRSGALTEDGGTSTLIINLDVLTADNVEFYKKVSSEPEEWDTMYDYLEFIVDGASKGKWCGEVDWSMESYAVAIGSHEFIWKYVKDGYLTEGSDCAWVDNIKLPAHQNSVTIINENSFVEENTVEAYPNPASDVVNLNVNLVDNTSAVVKVMNMSGQVVYEYSSEFNLYEGENIIVLNTSDFANGLYIIQLTTSNETYHRNIVISK